MPNKISAPLPIYETYSPPTLTEASLTLWTIILIKLIMQKKLKPKSKKSVHSKANHRKASELSVDSQSHSKVKWEKEVNTSRFIKREVRRSPR